MLNPFITPIDGDLSRADAVVLVQACRGKEVVEYGVGASTLLLCQCAASLVSIDTEQAWIDKVREKLAGVEAVCTPRFVLVEKQAEKQVKELPIFDCDVMFNDGHSLLRGEFLRQYWVNHVREQMILHDARTNYATNLIKAMMDWYDRENFVKERDVWAPNPYTACLRQIDWCPLESNMVVLHKRNCVLRYENWNETERGI